MIHPSRSTLAPQPAAKIGLRDIAAQLNVSKSLVSKVLSGNLGTSRPTPELIEAIRETAQRLGYRKNQSAASLTQGRQQAIAVYLHEHGAPGAVVTERLLRGIADAVGERDYRLMIHFFNDLKSFQAVTPQVHSNLVDGLIVGGFPHPEMVPELRELQARVPLVTACEHELAADIPNVGMNQVELVRLSTQHLIDRGCRRLLHFRVVADAPLAIPMRYEGYLKGLADRQIPLDRSLVLEIKSFGYDAAYTVLSKAIDAGIRFDGIVAQSDHQAAAAINLLTSRGIRVPQDVKVVGVDNAPFCDVLFTSLSSMSQEFEVRGRLAVDLLMDLQQGKLIQSREVPPVLHQRRSTE